VKSSLHTEIAKVTLCREATILLAILTRDLHASAKGVSAGSLNFKRLAESGSLKSIWKLEMLRSLVDLGAWYSLKLVLPGTFCEFQQICGFLRFFKFCSDFLGSGPASFYSSSSGELILGISTCLGALNLLLDGILWYSHYVRIGTS